MNSIKIFGVVICIIGIVLLFFGINAMSHIQDKATHAITGKYTDETMWYLISGIGMIVAGALIALFWKKR